METLILLVGGISTGLFLWAVYGVITAERKGPGKEEQRYAVEAAHPLIMIAIPLCAPMSLSLRSWEQGLRRGGAKAEHPFLQLFEFVSRSLITAGSPGGIRPEEILSLCCLSSVASAILFAMLAMSGGYPVGLFSLTAFVLGLALPLIWLNDRRVKRQLVIRNDLPYMLDIMTLCIEAGLDFTTALSRIIPKIAGSPLGYEMAAVLREIQIGKARGDSLRELAWRVNLSEVTTVVNAIIQAEKLGTSTGPAMRIQADEARRRRTLRAEELALKAPVKLLFPLVAFIFPTTFLILFAPVFIKNLPFLERLTR